MRRLIAGTLLCVLVVGLSRAQDEAETSKKRKEAIEKGVARMADFIRKNTKKAA